ncbi:Hint domain-containing protein [Asaia prunellae]|uniref:Hint domain-containing protein n=1 Tax=Asaia prunellae TaxID=610245 RepID=UPI00047049DA|nr:Hint domain-containing protein [Asaia prunellae]
MSDGSSNLVTPTNILGRTFGYLQSASVYDESNADEDQNKSSVQNGTPYPVPPLSLAADDVDNTQQTNNASTTNDYSRSANVDISSRLFNSYETRATGGTIVNGTLKIGSAGEAVTLSGAQVKSGGNLNVYRNASTVSAVVSSGGYINLAPRTDTVPGGTAIATTLLWGGTMNVYNSGFAQDTTISAGGVAMVNNGGVLTGAQVYSGGLISAIGGDQTKPPGVVSGATIYSRGVLRMRQGVASRVEATGSNNVIMSGGTIVVGLGSVDTGSVISSGGSAILAWSGGLVNTRLEPHGSLDFDYLGGNLVGAYMTSDGLLTVYSDNGKNATIQLAGKYDHNEFKFSGDTLEYLCFLKGTRISTPDGHIAVENISCGDEVLTWDTNAKTQKISKVSWAGVKTITPRPGLPDDSCGFPVIVKAGALDNSIPERDLQITPEHCLYIDGYFIPSRMLVNGKNIYYDRTVKAYDVYHIETENHSVLWAEGAMSESYLDTNNRHSFTQCGAVLNLSRNKNLSWENDAAAPLTTIRSVVEPIYQRILARVGMPVAKPDTIDDPDIKIALNGNKTVEPCRISGNKYVFMIEGEVRDISIASRSSRPCDVIGNFVDDRRNLGVLVGSIVVFDSLRTYSLTEHLTNKDLEGWHAAEGEASRWTDGCASLPIKARDAHSILIIAVEILSAGPYLVKKLCDDNIQRLSAL